MKRTALALACATLLGACSPTQEPPQQAAAPVAAAVAAAFLRH